VSGCARRRIGIFRGERYWGAPLPIWECEQCDHTEIVGSLERLDHLAGGAKNNYWAIRHGEAENITLDVIDSGDHDFHLTEKGRKQVASAGKIVAIEKNRPSYFSSDLPRTHETSEIIAKATGAPVRVDKRLARLILVRGRAALAPIYRNVFPHGEDKLTQRVEPNAESLTDVRARVWGFLQETERDFKGKNILIVSHEDTIWMLSQIANNWNDARDDRKKERRKPCPLGQIYKAGNDSDSSAEDRSTRRHRHGRSSPPVLVTIFFCHARSARRPCGACRKLPMFGMTSGAMPYAQAHYPFADGGARADASGSAEKLTPNAFRAGVSGGFHRRGHGSDARMVLHHDGDRDGAWLQSTVQERGGARLINDKFGRRCLSRRGMLWSRSR